MHSELGKTGEEVAAQYLESVLGWKLVERNARFTCGEIDLIGRDDAGEVVFVEVKTRKSGRFGAVAESLTPKKVQRFKRACLEWLRVHPGNGRFRMEFVGLERKDGEWNFERFRIE